MKDTKKVSGAKFSKTESYRPRNKKEENLVKALTMIKNNQDMANFLRDLMTLPEIEEFANRLEIARLLLKGESYQAIAKQVGVSTTTVTRTAHWLFNGCGGYWKVFQKLLK